MKYKKIPDEYFLTILDRISRFEPAYRRYKRVFDDIINKFSLDVKLKDININEQIHLVENIIQNTLGLKYDVKDDCIKTIFTELEDKYFNFNELSYQYLSSRVNFSAMIDKINSTANLPKNVQWLMNISESELLLENRNKFSLQYPVEKILLCEGETERILLSALLSMFDVNFYKQGILLVAAGGKNQVVRKFYSMLEDTKLPFFILLDSDAISLKPALKNKLRPIDKLYFIDSGEFEDLIPHNIIIDTINYIHKNDVHCLEDDFSADVSSVENIGKIYKKYGFGEFKKAQFARQLKEYITQYSNQKDFENSEIEKIAEILKS